jgi:hypothetical protein
MVKLERIDFSGIIMDHNVLTKGTFNFLCLNLEDFWANRSNEESFAADETFSEDDS